MRFATWNVNSIRARHERVLEWLDREQVDVLAMQETKCKPEQFPLEAFESAGYRVATHGLNQWNGVAIASRVGLDDVTVGFDSQPAFGKPEQEPVVEARAIGARCGGVNVWSIYVPNGRGLADPHYAYKLEFLSALRGAAASWLGEDALVAGDFNVAPSAADIWSEQDSEAVTHVTAEARAALAALEQYGYIELSRKFVPADHTYTFWDYKQLRFPRNEGMRIDFAFGSPSFASRAVDARIMRDERKGKGASDHVPVVIDVQE